MPPITPPPTDFVRWFRNSTPYINAFRDRTFVICFGGELLAEDQFAHLLHDITLLNSLGVRLVLVHGARPQIESRLQRQHLQLKYHNSLRITEQKSLECIKEAVGSVRIEIEAQLSMGQINSPMAGADIRVASGNYVTAQPLGVRDGIDYQYTGEVRTINSRAIHQQLDERAIVLLSPLGYSPTGEIFNLAAEDVATLTAVSLKADKLILMIDGPGLLNQRGDLIRQLQTREAEEYLQQLPDQSYPNARSLFSAIYACNNGVQRSHLLDRHQDGALINELFTRDGIGTLINSDPYEIIEQATIDDIGGLLELIRPLEEEGILARRSRELLEIEISRFTLIKRDHAIIACAALYPYPDEKVAELACLVVDPQYQGHQLGERLLNHLQQLAIKQGLKALFVLTTHTAHWFQQRGFEPIDLAQLPMERQCLYNLQRNSRVFARVIE